MLALHTAVVRKYARTTRKFNYMLLREVKWQNNGQAEDYYSPRKM